jgi:hypothetical protein
MDGTLLADTVALRLWLSGKQAVWGVEFTDDEGWSES